MEDCDTSLAAALFAEVLENAINYTRRQGTPVYTFAFYHDHESAAVSVCVDTEANSRMSVTKSNAFSIKYFAKAVADGDLKSASLWNANIGRSLSLGDFALVNVARWERQHQVAELSPEPDRLLFCCSGAKEEVAYLWSLNPTDV